MSKEAVLLKYWHELPAEAQDQVLEFAQSLRSQIVEEESTPQTPLGKKLWQIRQQPINAGVELLNQEQLKQELNQLRGDNCQSEASLHISRA
jgi:hypothetical protein